MVRTQVQLTEEQSERLREIAEQENVSMAELVRRAVDHWLTVAAPMSVEERKRRSLAAIGKYHSGLPDFAVNHDKYLNEGTGAW
ncbi:MAG: ribbon-helix-helix domain-containing protein [Caldilineaceae bacterium]|nr:CopG family transcriptional regulator [Caldilineaceae bacterium]